MITPLQKMMYLMRENETLVSDMIALQDEISFLRRYCSRSAESTVAEKNELQSLKQRFQTNLEKIRSNHLEIKKMSGEPVQSSPRVRVAWLIRSLRDTV